MAEEEGGTGIVGELRTAQETLEQAQARLEVERQILELKKEQGDVAQSDYETQLKINEISKIQTKIDENRSQLAKFQADIAKATKDQNEEEVARLKEQLELLKQQTVEEERQVELLTKQEKLRQATINHADNLFKRTFGFMYSEAPETSIGAFLTNPAEFSGRMKEKLGQLKDPLAVTTGLIDTVAQMSAKLALEQDAAVVTFNKATGASGEFGDNIRNLEDALFTTGVTSAEAGQAIQSLFLNVSDFTEMSEAQQQTLGETVAVLGELGISSETAAKNIQFATKVLGQSTSQAAALQRELFVFAQDLGVSASQIAGDFQTLAPQIAAMGKNGVDAFKNLEAQSKSTGLSMNELLGIVQKFDRFDTAAESVSRLNALLGGPFLNATELVAETDLSKRLEILKNRLDDAGLSFEQMDYYQRKSIASAAGLNEQQLALLMRGRIDLVQAPEKSAAEIEALAEQTAQFNTVMEELEQIARGFAVSFGPVISVLKTVLQSIQLISDYLPVVAMGLTLVSANMRQVFAEIMAFGLPALNALNAAEKRTLLIGGLFGFIQFLSVLPDAWRGVAVAIGLVVAAVLALGFAEKASVILGAAGILLGIFGALVHSMTVGNSPSLVEAFMMVAAAIPFMTLALMALMPLLPGLLLFVPPLALGFAALASSLEYLFEDKTVTNLKLISAEIANIVDKINELDTTKAIAVTATTAVAAGASAISGIAAGAMDAIGINVGATTPETAAATAPAGVGGPPAEIKLNITIDGESIAGAINNVEVSNYVKGQRSKLYDSIIDAVVGTQLVSS